MKVSSEAWILLALLMLLGCESQQQKVARRELLEKSHWVGERERHASPEEKEKLRNFIRQHSPSHDRHLGARESDVIAQFGKPSSQKVFTAGGDSFSRAKTERYRLIGRKVKELYYNLDQKIYIFWLIQVNGTWEVFAEVETPPGTQF